MALQRRAMALVALVGLALLGVAGSAAGAGRDLVVYPPLADNQYGSDLYEVTVTQGRKSAASYVYKSSREADNPYNKYNVFSTDSNHWTSFSFGGAVTVQIRLRDRSAVTTAVVHPLAKKITATVSKGVVSFTLTQPANLYIELDAKPREPLFVFANPLETNPPAKGAPGVLYFGPGVTDLGKEPCKVQDGQTVYLAGGAYVKGRFVATVTKGTTPVTIRGRGVLSGIDLNEKRGEYGQPMIDGTAHRTGPNSWTLVPELRVEGIVVTDSAACGVIASRRLLAENVKLLAWAKCSDGIGGGAGSVIKGCFLKVNDDAIYFFRSNIQVLDNAIWLQAAGSALQMGWNVKESMEGAHADGLYIIGDDTGRTHTRSDWLNACVVALMDMHDRALYRNVLVENIRHDGKPYQLFGIRTKLAPENGPGLASYRQGLGGVDGLVFRNVTSAQKPLHPSVFDGNGDEPGSISNVTFQNLRLGGELVTEANASEYIVQRGKTSGFRFGAAGGDTPQKRKRQ